MKSEPELKSRNGTLTGPQKFNRLNKSFTTSQIDSDSCLSPFCGNRIEPAPPEKRRRTPRRFCSDRCKLDHWALVRVRRLLRDVGPERAREILKRSAEPKLIEHGPGKFR